MAKAAPMGCFFKLDKDLVDFVEPYKVFDISELRRRSEIRNISRTPTEGPVFFSLNAILDNVLKTFGEIQGVAIVFFLALHSSLLGVHKVNQLLC